MLQQTLINGVDVSSKIINWEIDRSYGDVISQIEIKTIKTIEDLVVLDTGFTLVIYRGWTTATEEKVFDGYIESYEPTGGTIKIIGKDKMWDLVRKEVTHIYDSSIDASAGKISDIFKDLVETYGGLTAEVQDSGTSVLLSKFVCNHTDIFERCKNLAKVLDWQFYYRSDTNKVYFEPKGYSTNSTILTIGSNVLEVPKWTYDITEMANDITIAGAYQEIETTVTGRLGVTTTETGRSTSVSANKLIDNVATFITNGVLVGEMVKNTTDATSSTVYSVDSETQLTLNDDIFLATSKNYTVSKYDTTQITLPFEPISVKVYLDASNPPTTLKKGGVPNSSSSYDYYVDKNQKKIMPPSGSPFTANYYIEVRFSHAVPIPVRQSDDLSIATYGQFKKTVTYKDLRDVQDAENRGTIYLQRYAQPFIYATLKVKNVSTYSLMVGQSIRVVDSVSSPNVDAFMIIARQRIRYPADYDELIVGDKAWRIAEWQSSVEERLKRINEDELANQDLITEVITANNSSNSQIKYNPRYFKVLTDDGITGEELYTLLHYNNTYTEDFIDNDFKDAGYTQANWDNTNHQLIF